MKLTKEWEHFAAARYILVFPSLILMTAIKFIKYIAMSEPTSCLGHLLRLQ